MPRPFALVDSVDTPEGKLELRRRGASEFLVSIGGRVLMSSAIHRTESAVAELGCRGLGARPRPRVLVGGLGLGFTLRAVLDSVRAGADVVVAELNPAVVSWCRGPVAASIGDALADPRVRVHEGDVMQVVDEGRCAPFDAIVVDLYEGPRALPAGHVDSLYGAGPLARVQQALRRGGVYAVWSEEPYPPFEQRLRRLGFAVTTERVGRGGPRHVVYLARRL